MIYLGLFKVIICIFCLIISFKLKNKFIITAICLLNINVISHGFMNIVSSETANILFNLSSFSDIAFILFLFLGIFTIERKEKAKNRKSGSVP